MASSFEIIEMKPKPLIWWQHRRSEIDMNPSYQRHGRLWSDADKAYLIDSVINGFDIPKFYITNFSYKDSKLNRIKLPYAIIDGKQRLEAIFDFFDGKIRLKEDFIYIKNPSIKIGGYSYEQLQMKHPDIAEEYDDYVLTVMEVHSDSEELINDLFVRLNRSKPLTGAEIRNAMNNPAQSFIRQIANHEFFAEYISFSIKRMTDQDTAAKLFMMEFYDKLLETKKKNIDDFVDDSKSFEKKSLELAGRRSLDVLNSMTMIFLPRDILLSSAGVIPDYYWFIRNINEDYYSYIHPFLEKMEEQRIINNKLISQDPTNIKVSQEFVQLNTYYRSPNDASSHEGRYVFFITKFIDELLRKKIISTESQVTYDKQYLP